MLFLSPFELGKKDSFEKTTLVIMNGHQQRICAGKNDTFFIFAKFLNLHSTNKSSNATHSIEPFVLNWYGFIVKSKNGDNVFSQNATYVYRTYDLFLASSLWMHLFYEIMKSKQ